MKLKPLADRVVLRQNAAEERTSSGIFLTHPRRKSPKFMRSWKLAPAEWSMAMRSR